MVNNFLYQISGVAMGSAVAPSIAYLFIGKLEEEYILNPRSNPYYRFIKHYHRLIDNLIFILEDTVAPC